MKGAKGAKGLKRNPASACPFAPFAPLLVYSPRMAKKAQTPPKSFEDALSELERILADIEAGEIGLEESLAKYERGNFLIQHCRGILGAAEKQIEVIGKVPGGSSTGEASALESSPARETGSIDSPLPAAAGPV
jgi:exodeoxyribonuclease VII small subunit